MKSRRNYLRPFNIHEEHISIINSGIDIDFGTGIVFFGFEGYTMVAIGGGPVSVNGDKTTAKDSS